MSATIELPVDGLVYEELFEVEDVMFRASANGPSFFNGLGKFELRPVDGDASINGSIARDGTLSIGAVGIDSLIGVAFGELCMRDGFRNVIACVKT